ncbi:MAG: glycosyltransferase, partial [Candidatus Dormibacteria bacterium]
GVVPSVWPEPFGLVALEVMAAGRALVAARSGNLAELVSDGVTGLLVDPGDADQLSGALAKLLSDPGLRSALGAAAKRKSEEYTAAAVVPRMEGIYRGAIEGRAKLAGNRP